MLRILSICLLILAGIPAVAQDLTLAQSDLLIELPAEGGFHLFIRKKADIASVLITESTRDPALEEANYAYRAREWNAINGNEIRLLEGVPITPAEGLYFLVSSTPVMHAQIGEAFHIYIPWVLDYGYPYTRNGEIFVTEGTYFNIRTFEFPYNDYRGRFADNPFILTAQRPVEKPDGNFMDEAASAFAAIAQDGGGDFMYAANPEALIDIIENILHKEAGKSVDIVFALDTTASMRPYINSIRQNLITMMRETVTQFSEWRIGIVLYKDYHDEYLTRVIPFTTNFTTFQQALNHIQARGGGDIPEAVYEALYESADRYPWDAESRLIILIGDAPPHPTPRGRITREMVFAKAAENSTVINAIILAQ